MTDTGTGIETAHTQRVFEPFFTTKQAGKGTGLGLPIVYNIARQHGGFIDFHSKRGVGTTFFMYLAHASPSVIPDDIVQAQLPTGKARILVVDDEEVLRSIVSGMLRELGYQVSTAADGEEALRLLEARSWEFELVLTDVIMPKLDGVELLQEIRARHGATKVIAVTGLLSEEKLITLQSLNPQGFLKKPFSLSQLAHKVADVLKLD